MRKPRRFPDMQLLLIIMVLAGMMLPMPEKPVFAQPVPDIAAAERSASWPRNILPVHAVVVFTRFKGELPATTEAPSWAGDLFTGELGSVNDFFDRVSFGRIVVTGEHLPKVYELPHEADYYVDNLGDYSVHTLELLDADPDFNFVHYDNDGPDGIPGSSDDDGFVDYLILMPRTRPPGFIKGLATGFFSLSMAEAYFSSDRNSEGLLVRADSHSGCIATAKDYIGAAGTSVAEISHAYGSVDLMDTRYDDPEDDSAGVGNWDIVGRGALGWDGRSYSVGPNAYNRMRMGCVGINNDGLVDLYGIHQDVRVKPIGSRDGTLYRIWISENEYYLIENRRNDSFYYDNQLPGSGLMIWHIHEIAVNSNELYKQCDLECPDGRYLDAGYPLGQIPDPIEGGDNLDFWAHDAVYANEFGGNLGDATDIYDGVVYTEFGNDTNPNTYSKETLAPTGIEIFNIRRDGEDMLFDCIIPPLQPWFDTRFPLVGTAVQRFSAPDISLNSSKKTVYALFGANSASPDRIVIADGRDLTVKDLKNVDSFLVERLIAEEFISDGIRDSRIGRRAISLGDFAGRLADYNVALSDIDGEGNTTAVVEVTGAAGDSDRPRPIVLMQNYPNPFNASTTIPYVINQPENVVLEVYNVLGQRVITLDRGYQEAGVHEVRIDAEGFASGPYFYRVGGSINAPAKRFMLIR